jgi:hypothetical protein
MYDEIFVKEPQAGELLVLCGALTSFYNIVMI